MKLGGKSGGENRGRTGRRRKRYRSNQNTLFACIEF